MSRRAGVGDEAALDRLAGVVGDRPGVEARHPAQGLGPDQRLVLADAGLGQQLGGGDAGLVDVAVPEAARRARRGRGRRARRASRRRAAPSPGPRGRGSGAAPCGRRPSRAPWPGRRRLRGRQGRARAVTCGRPGGDAMRATPGIMLGVTGGARPLPSAARAPGPIGFTLLRLGTEEVCRLSRPARRPSAGQRPTRPPGGRFRGRPRACRCPPRRAEARVRATRRRGVF